MPRLRLLLREPVATGVVLWAVAFSGIAATPVPLRLPEGPHGQAPVTQDGRGPRGPAGAVALHIAHPLIAELPGQGRGEAGWGKPAASGPPAAPPSGAAFGLYAPVTWAGAPARPGSPVRAEAFVVPGSLRCRLLCTYRL